MAASGDAGSMIEVYPERATLDIPPSDDQVVFGENVAPPRSWPFHVLLSVPREQEEIERIGTREGWRAKTFGRGMQGQKQAPTTSPRDQKELLRTLVEEIIVTVHKAEPRAHLTLPWRGGALIELDLGLPHSNSR